MDQAAQPYRTLTSEDIIMIGDEWYNPDWEVGGPWYAVQSGNKEIGQPYDLKTMKLMRRPL